MLDRLADIIRSAIEDKDMVIDEDTVLLSDLGMNSLELVELVCEVEDKFGLEIPDRAIRGFKTVGDVAGYIETHHMKG